MYTDNPLVPDRVEENPCFRPLVKAVPDEDHFPGAWTPGAPSCILWNVDPGYAPKDSTVRHIWLPSEKQLVWCRCRIQDRWYHIASIREAKAPSLSLKVAIELR
jgi:hypothetical protein